MILYDSDYIYIMIYMFFDMDIYQTNLKPFLCPPNLDQIKDSNPKYQELIQSCLDSDLVVVTGRHSHPPHELFVFYLCSELSNYKKIRFGIEYLPTTLREASTIERRKLYKEAKHCWFGGPGTLYCLEGLQDTVDIYGLERVPELDEVVNAIRENNDFDEKRKKAIIEKLNKFESGLSRDFIFCRYYYDGRYKDTMLIEEIKNQNLNIVLVGEKHYKNIYNTFKNCKIINQSCNFLNYFTPLKIEIKNSLLIKDSCVNPLIMSEDECSKLVIYDIT